MPFDREIGPHFVEHTSTEYGIPRSVVSSGALVMTDGERYVGRAGSGFDEA